VIVNDEELRAELAKLKPSAEPDHRHPYMYEESVPAAVEVLTRYFAALARRDLEGMASALHFPHASYEASRLVVVNSAEELRASPPPSMNIGVIREGAFDMLDGIEVHVFDPVSAGLALTYTRFRRDGSRLSVCEGVYGITKNDGRWGIEAASTIVVPADQVGVTYEETIDNAMRLGREWMEGWSENDGRLLDSTRQYGARAGLYPDTGRRMSGARAGNLHYVFRSEGLASRLRVTELEPGRPGYYNYEWFNDFAGHGVGGWAYSLFRPDGRVLHHSHNKAHVLGGFNRYQADGTLLSEYRSISVITKVDGHWGMNGGMGGVTHHDTTNDDWQLHGPPASVATAPRNVRSSSGLERTAD
jgi:hypothetical protein